MNSSYLSLYIYGDGCNENDIQRAGRFLAECGCEYYNLTMAARYNESEKVIRLLHAIAPKARAIWRGWPSAALEDGGIWQRVKPVEWINYRIIPNRKWLQELNVLVLPCNEVGTLGADTRTYSQWEANVIRLSHIEDVELAVLRLSTGNPLETEHENFNAVLQAASEFDAVLSPNEYTSIHSEITSHWHVGRYHWMWEQQDKLGVKRSPVVIGEYAIARVNADKSLDPNHGYVAESVNIADHIKIIKSDGLTYQKDGTTVCWFVDGHWQQGAGSFDVQNNEPLLAAVETEAKAGHLDIKRTTDTHPTVPPLPPAVSGKRYTVNKLVTIYAAPSISSGSMGTIPDQGVVLMVDEEIYNSEVWRKIKYLATTGYIAMNTSGVKMTEYIPVVSIPADSPPVVIPTPPVVPPVVTTPPAPTPNPNINLLAWALVAQGLRDDAARFITRAQQIEHLIGQSQVKV